MGVFGAKYPERLQAVINHGERLRDLLVGLEAWHPDPRRWLVGRREEIELVLRLRVRDWRARRIGIEYATKTIGAYLEDLHAGATESLGLPANVPLECCAPGEAVTIRLLGRAKVAALVETAETWFDLNALLDLGPPGDGARAGVHGETSASNAPCAATAATRPNRS